MSEPILKYYTIADLRNWLIHNQPAEGLSEQVIAPQRAWAILNNPYVKDEDAVVSAIFEDGCCVAYTACFPEIITAETACITSAAAGSRIWWLTTLYCTPECAGRGYGLIVVGQLYEMHEGEPVMDADGAKETVEICKMLGQKDHYQPMYALYAKHIDVTSLKGKLALAKETFVRAFQSQQNILKKEIKEAGYNLVYPSFISDAAYQFILSCSNKCSFVRSQEMLSWIVEYPFMKDSPLKERVNHSCAFSSELEYYSVFPVEVYNRGDLVGIYILRNCPWGLSVKYLYYMEDYRTQVFLSIAEHVLSMGCCRFETHCLALCNFLSCYRLFAHYEVIDKSLTTPDGLFPKEMLLQAGDGDMFV